MLKQLRTDIESKKVDTDSISRQTQAIVDHGSSYAQTFGGISFMTADCEEAIIRLDMVMDASHVSDSAYIKFREFVTFEMVIELLKKNKNRKK